MELQLVVSALYAPLASRLTAHVLGFTLFLVCLAVSPVWAHQPDSAAVSGLLTAAEQAFLAAHPEIRLGGGEGWEPLVLRRPDGGLEGFEVDLLQEISARTGAQIKMVVGPWQEIVERAEERKLDGLAMSAANQERAESFLFSDSYLKVYPVFVVAANSPRKIEQISDLAGATVAILAGHKFYAAMLAAYPQINVVEQSSEADAIRMVLEGRAAAAVVATTHFAKHSRAFSGLIKIGHVATDHPLALLYSIRKDWPELVSILNKGLAALPTEIYERLYHRWFEIVPPAVQQSEMIEFSAAEQLWLAQKHAVRAHVIDYPPYHSFVDGRAQGMAIDYLDIAAKRAGFMIEYVDNNSWAQALADIRVPRKVDLLPAAYNTAERREDMVFTRAALVTPSVIFVREDSPFVSSLADFAGKTVAVERDFATHRWLEKDFPALQLLIVGTTKEALQAVSGGIADAYVGSLTVASYIIKTAGLTNLKIAAPSPFGNDEQAIAVRRDWPELASIIDKALATMTEQEQADIRNRWLPPIQYDSGISSQDVLLWIAEISSFLLAIIVVILIWNKKLGREIAARAAAEDHLKQSEEKYRTLFERSADAILIIEDGLFVDCNEAAIKMLGYADKSEFLLTGPTETSPVTQPDGRASVEKAAEMIAIALAQGSHRFEWLRNRANGEPFPVEVLLTAIPSENKQILHVVWRDITVRKQAENLKAELTEELYRKNAELERFTYTVSHDLKSPLITIKGFVGILEQSLADKLDEDDRLALTFINRATQKMYDLLEDLLELSRIGRVVNATEKVNLSEVAQEAIDLVGGLMVNRSIAMILSPDLPAVRGDSVRLREVFQNLLENSIKYMGDQAEPRIEIGVAESPGQKRACYVRDNGMGIAPEYHEKVFGLFERLSNDSEGTGVGLAQVRRIIELHGGEVWIESSGDGQGTTFWFTLPWHES